ncbi:MAG: phytanoyl-CoA dioxygenase family protein [Candidatus Poribacteria bacterium]|nr:phytanoyl-CoA dioxygenase family protein [Candidatus Poribacteria bacterium]
MGVSTDEIKRLEEDGFLVKRQLIDKSWLRQIQGEIDARHETMAAETPQGVGVSWEEYDDPKKPRRIRQLMHAEVVSPGLNRVVDSPNVLDVLEPIMGENISLFHSKLLMKAAYDGTITPWHQDYAYWYRQDNRPLMINCMLFLDDADAENGSIQFVPGSHKGGLLEHDRANMSFGVFLPGYFEKRDDAVLLEMEAGDAVFFGPLVIHGSDANTSDRDRRACTTAYDVTGNGYCRRVVRGAAQAERNF